MMSIVFIAALSLRGIALYLWSHTPYWGAPLIDAQYYDQWGRNIAAGISRGDAFFGSPFYAYVLGFFYKIFENIQWPLILFQIFLSAGISVMVFLITEIIFDSTVAFVSGILCSLNLT